MQVNFKRRRRMELLTEAFHNGLEIYAIRPTKEWIDIQMFLKHYKKNVKKTLKKVLNKLENIKFQLSIQLKLKKFAYDGEEIKTHKIEPVFNSTTKVMASDADVNEKLSHAGDEIIAHFQTFLSEGSGWLIIGIEELLLKVYEYEPFEGGGTHLKLPEHIKKKQACINLKCEKNMCFIYCILYCLSGKTQSYVPKYTKYWENVNATHLEYPVNIKNLPVFEEDNTHISINVVTYTKGFIPIYVSNNRTSNVTCKVNLLLYRKHFYVIKNLSRLLFRQLPNKKFHWYFCHYCLCRFRHKKKFVLHEDLCKKNLQAMETPKVGTKISFKNYIKMIKLPFVLYYDMESLLVKNDAGKLVRTHEPISVCLFRKCIDDSYTKAPMVFTGKNCVKKFLKYLPNEIMEINSILQNHKQSIKWTAKDERHYIQTKQCEICKIKFTRGVKKCRDHHHIYLKNTKTNARFVLCNRCNLTYAKQRSKIPIIGHFASGYDMKHIVKNLFGDVKNIHIIPKNTEKFIALCFKKLNVVFLDSGQFLPTALRTLVDNLLKCDETYVRNEFLKWITKDKRKQDLLMAKGVFCYDFLDHHTKLSCTSLPPKKDFYDSLNNQDISNKDYERAQNLWDQFNCKTIKDFMEIYEILDTVLLASVFEKFRNTTYQHFTLDPAQYISSPGLSYDAMLLKTAVKIDTIPSIEMYSFFTSGIRGGICEAPHRYAQANNVSSDVFDENRDPASILSVDINSLYAYVMEKYPMPYKDFRWLSEKEISELDIGKLNKRSKTGYYLDVCLGYPDDLHDKHNQFPLAPEKKIINRTDWSPYMIELQQRLGTKRYSKVEKLLLTLDDKHCYKLHYLVLKFYLEMGLKLLRINAVVAFKQKPFLKKFIQMNNEKRSKSTNVFDSDLYKGYNNSTFGKLCMNVFKQREIKLVNDLKDFKKIAGKPTFKSAQIIRPDLVSVQFCKNTIVCNTPIACGQCILDLSKILLYKYFYQYFQQYYNGTCRLQYCDTDSLTILVQDKEPLENLLINDKFYDRSNFPPKSKLYNDKFKRKSGLIKNNFGEETVQEFCALAPKMYCVALKTTNEVKAKGIKKHIAKNFTIQQYKHALFTAHQTKVQYKTIRSYKQQLYTEQMEKISLTPWCDKRYYTDPIKSLAYGHHAIKRKIISTHHFEKRRKCYCGQTYITDYS